MAVGSHAPKRSAGPDRTAQCWAPYRRTSAQQAVRHPSPSRCGPAGRRGNCRARSSTTPACRVDSPPSDCHVVRLRRTPHNDCGLEWRSGHTLRSGAQDPTELSNTLRSGAQDPTELSNTLRSGAQDPTELSNMSIGPLAPPFPLRVRRFGVYYPPRKETKTGLIAATKDRWPL
jgi:hypothetical protein